MQELTAPLGQTLFVDRSVTGVNRVVIVVLVNMDNHTVVHLCVILTVLNGFFFILQAVTNIGC